LLSLFAIVGFTTTAPADLLDLRITEVDPDGDTVEITNTGAAFSTSAARPFCYAFNYSSTIPASTNFAAGGIQTFSTSGLSDTASDIWLYQSGPFGTASNMIHGAQFGGTTSGRTSIADSVGLWSGDSHFAPLPGVGETLAWDGADFTVYDWYVDATPSLGSADTVAAGSVGPSLIWPNSVQDFEGLQLGDSIETITNWVVVDSSAPGVFTQRVVGTVGPNSAVTPSQVGSTKWLRIRDTDGAGGSANRFYSGAINAPGSVGEYLFTFYVYVEIPPAGSAANNPVFNAQHSNGGGFSNAWGIGITDTNIELVRYGFGGGDTTTVITSYTPGTWVKLDLFVDFNTNFVSGQVDDGPAASLPITPDVALVEESFRFCYRGEETDNTATILLDDLSFMGSETTLSVQDWEKY
jgi:hypothetical protein